MSPPSTPPKLGQLAARIRSQDLERLAPLRATAGIEVLLEPKPNTPLDTPPKTAPDDQWLRGGEVLRGIPHLELSTLKADGTLVPFGKRLPTRRLPADATWIPLAEAIKVHEPSRLYPGQFVEQALELTLVRSEVWRLPQLLRSNITELLHFAERHAAQTLGAFQFAMKPNGEVLLRNLSDGALPLLSGHHYVMQRLGQSGQAAVAWPCGWAWSPAVRPSVLVAACGLAPGELGLFAEDSSWEKLSPGDWVNASRSAVRLSHRQWCEQGHGHASAPETEQAGGEPDGN